MSRMDWFRAAKLGLFIHFDHASQQGVELSWPLLGRGNGSTATAAQYHSSAATFDPVRWNPAALAEHASAAGMRYAVFTAKHHSGWAAWPSKVAPFTIASSPYGRRGGDLVREYVDAFRAAGLRIGIYCSLPDWSHPDYPAWTDQMRPYQHDTGPAIADLEAWQRFRQVLKDELAELLTWYGEIDLLWFDGQWERTAEVWGSAELRDHIRSLAPDVAINDRLPDAGDYATPEQAVPGVAPEGAWETCLTMNDCWGYIPGDRNYKSLTTIVTYLAEIASKGGNLLLNVGPTGTGEVPEPELSILDGLAAWMRTHGESITGTTAGLEAWQFYGPTTRRGDTVYLHMVGWPAEHTSVRGMHPRRVRSCTLLDTGESLPFRAVEFAQDGSDRDPVGELVIDLPVERPDGPLPVVRVDFADGPVAR
jgi:alpha-L-fucosidase